MAVSPPLRLVEEGAFRRLFREIPGNLTTHSMLFQFLIPYCKTPTPPYLRYFPLYVKPVSFAAILKVKICEGTIAHLPLSALIPFKHPPQKKWPASMPRLHPSETIQIFCLEILSLPAKIQIFLENPQFQQNNLEKIFKSLPFGHFLYCWKRVLFCNTILFTAAAGLRTAFLSNPYL